MKRPAVLYLTLVCLYSILYTFLVFTLVNVVHNNPAVIALLSPLLPLACVATYAALFRSDNTGPKDGPGPDLG